MADGTPITRRCRPGQVLFGKRRAYQRKVAVAEFDAVVPGVIYVLAPKGNRLLPELLPFLCLSERFFQHAVGTSAGSLSPRTNWSSLASFEFDLPPLDQQRHDFDRLVQFHEGGRGRKRRKPLGDPKSCAGGPVHQELALARRTLQPLHLQTHPPLIRTQPRLRPAAAPPPPPDSFWIPYRLPCPEHDTKRNPTEDRMMGLFRLAVGFPWRHPCVMHLLA